MLWCSQQGLRPLQHLGWDGDQLGADRGGPGRGENSGSAGGVEGYRRAHRPGRVEASRVVPDGGQQGRGHHGADPRRIATQAQFAALCGVAPIPASSGKTNRHRLSRGGDRQANRALHWIVLIRMRFREPRTMAYFARRRAEGLADRDIIRCLKRHVANEVFALLTHPSTEPLPGPSLRRQRQALGIRLTDAAGTLGVPYQRLRRLELGTRTDPDLVHRCQHWLDETAHQRLRTA